MRLLGVLMAALLMLGCGTGHGNGDPHIHVGVGLQAPFISQLTPNNAPVNSPPFTMIVNGTNFRNDAVVYWNDNPQSTFPVSPTELQTTVTDADLMFGGAAHVFVRTGGMNSNTVDFNVTAQ